MSLATNYEKGFLGRFGTLLTLADHKARLDRLIIDDVRWKDDRNSRAAVAKRVIALMPEVERKRAEARLAVFLQQKGALGVIQAAPAGDKSDWGFTFHKIQALRRADKIDEAAKIMLSVPKEPGAVNNNDEWWIERRTLAYASLRKGQPKLAYEIVSDAGPLTVNPLKDQSFMAGWLALRYLKKPAKAKPHFETMQKAADGPLSRAKAHYWAGRTAEALKDKAAATLAYQEAIRDRDTFHGLLAMQKLEPGRTSFPITPPDAPTPEEIEKFNSLDAAKAVVIAHKAKGDSFTVRRVAIDYLGMGSYPGQVEVGSCVLDIGESSFVVGQGVFMDDRCLVTGETVHVQHRRGERVPLSDGLRTALEAERPR